MSERKGPNPSGLCMCGCGGLAPVAKLTNKKYSHVAGESVRFIHNHDKRKHQPIFEIAADTGCWVWRGRTNRDGYGKIGRQTLAHRAYYEALVGPIPDGLTIDHLCRNRACVNPDHMEPVPAVENVRRGLVARGG